MSDVERAREVMRLAHKRGGAMEGLQMGFNSNRGYFVAAVSIAGPRQRPPGGRWKRGSGTTCSTALQNLLQLLRAEQ